MKNLYEAAPGVWLGARGLNAARRAQVEAVLGGPVKRPTANRGVYLALDGNVILTPACILH